MRLVLLAMGILLTGTATAFADEITFYTEESSWEAVVGTSNDILTTAASDVAKASEVSVAPGSHADLGDTLTFDTSSTGFAWSFSLETLQSGASFIYSDHPANPSFGDHLSVGDVDVHEHDDFRLTILSGPDIYALAIEIGENEAGDSGESIKVYGKTGVLLGTLDDPFSPTGGVGFFGVTSTVAIGWIDFDEHPGDDDMWIGGVHLSPFNPIPEPSSLALIGLALGSAVCLKKRSQSA